MSRRIEIELTSARPDGTWTWRAPGAQKPRGVMGATLLPAGAKVGDVLRAEVESDLDGITVTEILSSPRGRKGPDLIQLVSERAFEPVTQVLASRGDRPSRDFDGPRRDRGDRPPRSDRPDRGPRPDRRPGGGGPGGPGGPAREHTGRPPREGAGERPRRDRPARPPVPEMPERPKPKRLRAGRTHRNALLASLPEEQRIVAEQVLRGGIPSVRQAVQDQNDQLKAAGQAEIRSGGVLALAEELLPRVRVAEWLDRAEGAVADLDELDLRDLRSVVAAVNDPGVSRDESTRGLAEQLREGLNRRQDEEHSQWLGDIGAALDIGRLVRALRLSSRPPKAGVRFPTDTGTRLAEATTAALTPDASGERWAAVVEALAYSPVRGQVKVVAPPATVTDELKSAIGRVSGLLPELATLLGVQPPAAGARPARPRPGGGRPPAGKTAPRPPRPPAPPAPPAPPVADAAVALAASAVDAPERSEASTESSAPVETNDTPGSPAASNSHDEAARTGPAETTVEAPAPVEHTAPVEPTAPVEAPEAAAPEAAAPTAPVADVDPSVVE